MGLSDLQLPGTNARRSGTKAKSGPRNSRELAILNQFLHAAVNVVEFLVDTPWGVLWWEMSDGETALKERAVTSWFRPGDNPTPSQQRTPAT